ncbi:hypothetical protein BS78_K269600 [Paspalum vaginatum]|uniref:Obtusifoliol 14-alpha demethylase n=1 Tax=Paspalum vaginatum TaxID=158149 RepID=A0A9W7XE21_9POAL|nr:hypothetical protein BS78_K269600 [Paspalum vaginatum]
MDLTNIGIWVALVVIWIATVLAKMAMTRRMTRDHPVSNRPHPPVVSGFFLLNPLRVLLTKGVKAMTHEQHRALGSVFTLSFFGVNITFLVGPEVLDHFFQGSESEISHCNVFEFMVPILGKGVGFGADITTRTEQMRFHNDALKRPKIRNYIGAMLQEVEEYLAKWGQHGTVDIKHEMEQLVLLISSRCLLGKEIREKMLDEAHTLFRDLSGGMSLTSVLFPYAPTPTNRRRDAARAKLAKMFTEIVKSRRRGSSAGHHVQEDDVLQNLIDSKYKDGRPTTEAEVTGLIIMLLFGANNTSSVTSTWTGACLLSHGRWLAAAAEEQREIARRYGDRRRIDHDALLEMDTLHRCVKEALRMHPVIPVFFRKLLRGFTLRTKEGIEYEIPGGHHLASPALFNSRLPYVYRDPNVYDPDRFGPQRQEDKAGGRFSFTAFGGGRHSCVGEAYAYMQIKVIWSYLLRNFELKLVSPFPDTDWSKLVPSPKGNVMVSYKRVPA